MIYLGHINIVTDLRCACAFIREIRKDLIFILSWYDLLEEYDSYHQEGSFNLCQHFEK